MRKGRRERQNELLMLSRSSARLSRSRCTEKNQVRFVAEALYWLTMVALTFSISTMKSISTSIVSLNFVALEVKLKSEGRFA